MIFVGYAALLLAGVLLGYGLHGKARKDLAEVAQKALASEHALRANVYDYAALLEEGLAKDGKVLRANARQVLKHIKATWF